jgi:hypothetical protein
MRTRMVCFIDGAASLPKLQRARSPPVNG